MLDRDGYRANVCIVLINGRNQVFWGKRIREHSWQFPQGGIKRGESPEQAMFRELQEEVGLLPEHVRIVGRTRDWLRYEVPDQWVRREWRGHYRGQKQIWFLLRLVGRDTDIDLRASDHPEFDAWRWHDYWVPLDAVIEFKRDVYRLALHELSRLLPGRPENVRFLRQGARHRGRAGARDAGHQAATQDDGQLEGHGEWHGEAQGDAPGGGYGEGHDEVHDGGHDRAHDDGPDDVHGDTPDARSGDVNGQGPGDGPTDPRVDLDTGPGPACSTTSEPARPPRTET